MSRSDCHPVGQQLAPGNLDLGKVSIILRRLANTVKTVQAAWFMVCARKVVPTCSVPSMTRDTVFSEVPLYTVFHACYYRWLWGRGQGN